ncbi:MAG: TolC family protein [Treponemataceae bacterium]
MLFAVNAQEEMTSSPEPEKAIITVQDAVDMAIENNLSIERSKIDLNALKRSSRNSWGGLSPTLSIGAGFASPNEKVTYDYSTNFTGNIGFSLYPTLFTNIHQTRLEYESGKITYTASVRSIELSVRKAFFLLLYQDRYVDTQKRNLDISKKQYDQATARYREGRVSELDMLQSQVNYENLKPAVLSAMIQYDNNMQNFKQLIGVPLASEVELNGRLESVFDLRQITEEEIVGRKSLTIISLEQALKTAKFARSAATANLFLPTLSVGWGYNPAATNRTISDKWTDSGQLSASLSLAIDKLLPWSSEMELVGTAKDAVKKTTLQLEDEYINFEVKTSSYMRSILQSQALIESKKANVELAKKSYQMTLDAYNRGAKDLLALQTSSESLLEAEVNLLSEGYTLISNILDLEHELNVPFGELRK